MSCVWWLVRQGETAEAGTREGSWMGAAHKALHATPLSLFPLGLVEVLLGLLEGRLDPRMQMVSVLLFAGCVATLLVLAGVFFCRLSGGGSSFFGSNKERPGSHIVEPGRRSDDPLTGLPRFDSDDPLAGLRTPAGKDFVEDDSQEGEGEDDEALVPLSPGIVKLMV